MTGDRQRIYVDYNATAPLRPAALAAMTRALSMLGNPSSIHAEGRAVRGLLEEAREAVGCLVGALAKQVIFTSGGTEAANLALTPHIETVRRGGPIERLLVGATEHACVLRGHRFPPDCVTILPVDANGLIDLAALDEALAGAGRSMLAVQLANNETGVIQPVREAAAIVHARDGLLVCDAVQAAGKLALDIAELGADMLLLSAHKFGGPKGAGALVLGAGVLQIGSALLRGGGQEKGLRAGTENVAAMVGFGAACAEAQNTEGEAERLAVLRDALEAAIRSAAPTAQIFGSAVARLANTSAFAVPGIGAETLLIGLDLEGVAVSSGAACSSGKVARSHVLDAMGVAAGLAAGAIRLSLGWASLARDVEGFAGALAKVLQKIEQRRRVAA